MKSISGVHFRRRRGFGAVRQVLPSGPKGQPELLIYVENAGDFAVPLDAVHSQEVVVNCRKLGEALRKAIGHAHDDEKRGV